MKQKLPVLRIKAHDIGRQHIDGEIRRELRNALAVLLGEAVSLIACHEVSTCTFATALDARARRILRMPALHCRNRTPAFLNLEFLDKLAPNRAAAHTPDARATFAALQTRRRCHRRWSNPALTTCACLRNRKVARLAER